jgi:hypothetical protein
MADNFFGPDPSYHLARRRFVRKLPSSVRAADNIAALAA